MKIVEVEWFDAQSSMSMYPKKNDKKNKRIKGKWKILKSYQILL